MLLKSFSLYIYVGRRESSYRYLTETLGCAGIDRVQICKSAVLHALEQAARRIVYIALVRRSPLPTRLRARLLSETASIAFRFLQSRAVSVSSSHVAAQAAARLTGQLEALRFYSTVKGGEAGRVMSGFAEALNRPKRGVRGL